MPNSPRLRGTLSDTHDAGVGDGSAEQIQEEGIGKIQQWEVKWRSRKRCRSRAASG